MSMLVGPEVSMMHKFYQTLKHILKERPEHLFILFVGFPSLWYPRGSNLHLAAMADEGLSWSRPQCQSDKVQQKA